MVADHLKQADKYILKNEFNAAEAEVNKAVDLDPANIYALAYLERVKHYRIQYEKKMQEGKQPQEAGQKPTSGSTKTSGKVKETSPASRIIIIDDEPDYLEMLGLLLSGAGYQVVSASSPEEAIEKLKSFVPDLILCDIHFDNSGLDGFSLYSHVRKTPGLVAVPFIFITGVKDEKIHQSSLEIGVDDFIAKPFSGSTLLAAVGGKIKRFNELRRMGKE